MGLAILDLEDSGSGQLQLVADTGTNPWFQLRFGKKAGRRDGFDEIDELVHTTALTRNARAGWAFDTRVPLRVPTALVRRARYAQLVSYKDERGRSPAYSKPVVIAVGAGSDDEGQLLAFSLEAPMSVPSFEAPRSVPCRTVAESFALPPAVGDLLGQIVRLAGPVVADLLKPATGQSGQSGQPAPAAGAPGIIADILRAILGAVSAPTPVPVATGQSLVRPRTVRPAGNRFNGPTYARQQIFGIDDALLATMIGPVLQVLPQLLNAASQEKIQLRQANNKLITDLMAGLDRRRMMELLAQARAASPGNPALAALNGLFEDEAAARAALPPPAPVAAPQSIESAPAPPVATSSKAVLSFLLAPPVEWYGEPRNVFSKANPMALHVQLDVGASGPKKPLPRSVVHLVVKDGTERVLHQQDFRLVDIEPGKPIVLDLEPGDVSHLPTNVPLSVAAQLRWPGARPGSAYQASAVIDVVLVDRVFVTGQGGPVAGDQELVDMQPYRSFWNKVWESPTTQAAPGADGSSHWNLEAAIKYTVLFAPAQASNGLMQTKGLTVAPDPDSPVDRTEGRFKGGIELSLVEVNKLLPLWPGEQPLQPDVLAALATPEFARRTAGEVIHSLRLKGGKRERGLVWAVPVFSLRDVHLAMVEATDASGQVIKVGQQRARFPVPSAVRVLTMKSEG